MEFSITHCNLCPRQCGIDRNFFTGFCGGGSGIRAARAALHFWEEPCISGTRGSGTVFFSGCSLRCCFCQNASISMEHTGKDISISRLVEIFLELQAQGAHNINLVTGTHYLPWILSAIDMAKPRLHIPIVYNSSGYETVEAIRKMNGYIDIYLPDFKYFDPETARRYAHAPDYPETAKAAIAEMIAQTGSPVLEDGILKKGCIVRHLVLPGHRHASISLLRYLASKFSTDTFLLSLMAQYTPPKQDTGFRELTRRITKMEYHSVLREAQTLGFHGFMQEISSAKEEYTPHFDLTGIE